MSTVNIFITSTPEVPTDLIDNVCDILNIPGSDLNFSPATPINIARVNSLNPYFPVVNHGTIFTFNNLFYLCNFFRNTQDKLDTDFVVILTSHRNEFNWFSATENRNIFVHTEDWEILTKKENKFGVAYQVIENIFQSLIGSSYEVTEESVNVHFKPIGCINITYQDWIASFSDFVNAETKRDYKKPVLYGLSAGGMVCYNAACYMNEVHGIIGMCFLDNAHYQVINF